MKPTPEDKTFKDTVASIERGVEGSIDFISKDDAQAMVKKAKSMLRARGSAGFQLEITTSDETPPGVPEELAKLDRFLPKNYSIDPKSPFLILATIAPSGPRLKSKCQCQCGMSGSCGGGGGGH
jgi:hypothetical protein